MTEFASLKPAGINKGRKPQNPTSPPTDPTSFLQLKETRQHIQPTQQVTIPPVINLNASDQSAVNSYSYEVQLKNIQEQTKTKTFLDVDNITASTSVKNQHNQSQIIKQSGGTKSSVTNDTDLIESVKKNTSQAPMRTTDNNAR